MGTGRGLQAGKEGVGSVTPMSFSHHSHSLSPPPSLSALLTFCSSSPCSTHPSSISYELPDGQLLKVKNLRQSLPELLFRTDLGEDVKTVMLKQTQTPSWMAHFHAVNLRPVAGAPNSPATLPLAIHGALLACGAEVRRDLCSHVLLTGGASLLKDLEKRLHWELLTVVPAAFKPRIVTPGSIERMFAPWIGGSILSSLGTFQQMWISREEFYDEGAGVVERKCMS